MLRTKRVHRRHPWPAIERLDRRLLLSDGVYTLPNTAGLVAYLTTPASPTIAGQVDVRLNSDTSPPVATVNPDPTKHTLRINARATGQTLVDEVPAMSKPAGGINFSGWSHNTLEVVAGPYDRQIDADGDIRIHKITTTDPVHGVAALDTWDDAVSQVTIRTNDNVTASPSEATTVNADNFYDSTVIVKVDTGPAKHDVINLDRCLNALVHTGAGDDTVNLFRYSATIDFGAGTGAGDGLGLGNSLFVDNVNGVAYLGQVDGPSHVVVLDNALCLGTVEVQDPSLIGQVSVKPGGALIVGAPATIEDCSVDAGGFASIQNSADIGRMIVDGTADFTYAPTPTTVNDFGNSPGEVNIWCDMVIVQPATIGTLNIRYPDMHVLMQSSQHIGSLNVIDASVLTLQARASDPVSAGPRVLYVNSLNMVGDSQDPVGTLDLNDNDLIIDYPGGPSPLATWNGNAYEGVLGYIASGRNGGAWNGHGIVSSLASTNSSNETIGAAEASEVFGITDPQTALFDGETVDGSTVLVKYTYGGDANLDGKVNIDDYTRIDSGIAVHATAWFNGDFNYDGKIDIDDYIVIDSGVGGQGPPL